MYYQEQHAPTCAAPERIEFAVSALMPFWGQMKLNEITPTACRRYAEQRNVAPGTIRKELGTLVAAQNFLRREGKLEKVSHVPLPPAPAPKDRFLTLSEAARLVNAARNGGQRTREYLPLFMLLGLYTGARSEAILSLSWDRVDLPNERIDFIIPGRMRTKKRRPRLPIPRKLKTFLVYAYSTRLDSQSPVLHIDGRPIKRVIRGFKAAAERAGLSGVTPHTLRHTCGTWLAQRGVSLWEIAGYLGQDPQTTERIYAHHHPTFMSAAKRAADRS